MSAAAKAINVVTLYVDDEQRSKEFYEALFGIAGTDQGHGTVIFELENLFLRLLRRDEARSETLGQVPIAEAGAAASSQLAFFVESADALLAELEERGVEIAWGPVDRAWGVRNAGFRDPDGHVWGFSSAIPE